MSAKDIWEKDKAKRETITEEREFSVFTVWESDDLKESINYIMEKIHESEKSKDS